MSAAHGHIGVVGSPVLPCDSSSLLFILFVTVHRKTNFLVNLYWDNKYSDSHSSNTLDTQPSFPKATH